LRQCGGDNGQGYCDTGKKGFPRDYEVDGQKRLDAPSFYIGEMEGPSEEEKTLKGTRGIIEIPRRKEGKESGMEPAFVYEECLCKAIETR